jgi:Ser/Thr protein kinase RdoA (MazF antagonist)
LGPPTRAAHPAAADLHAALAPWRHHAREAHAALARLSQVLIHGDANPTNIVRSGGSVLTLDFGASGAGHCQLEQSEGDFRRFASAIYQVACDV